MELLRLAEIGTKLCNRDQRNSLRGAGMFGAMNEDCGDWKCAYEDNTFHAAIRPCRDRICKKVLIREGDRSFRMRFWRNLHITEPKEIPSKRRP